MGEKSLAGPILIETTPGDLIDKITILEIKSERIGDAAKLRNIQRELASLADVRDRMVPMSEELAELTRELTAVNEALWRVEDELRLCERAGNFGPTFVQLARSVYRWNDQRAALKRRINELLGARFLEEKSYEAYDTGGLAPSCFKKGDADGRGDS
jgi:hypothetical protein